MTVPDDVKDKSLARYIIGKIWENGWTRSDVQRMLGCSAGAAGFYVGASNLLKDTKKVEALVEAVKNPVSLGEIQTRVGTCYSIFGLALHYLYDDEQGVRQLPKRICQYCKELFTPKRLDSSCCCTEHSTAYCNAKYANLIREAQAQQAIQIVEAMTNPPSPEMQSLAVPHASQVSDRLSNAFGGATEQQPDSILLRVLSAESSAFRMYLIDPSQDNRDAVMKAMGATDLYRSVQQEPYTVYAKQETNQPVHVHV